MGITQNMLTVIPLVALPAIMYGMTLKLWQNPHLIHGLSTPFVMHKVVGQPVGCRYMQPPQLLVDPQSSFVKVNHFRVLDGSLNLRFDGGKTLKTLFSIGVQGAFGDRHP